MKKITYISKNDINCECLCDCDNVAVVFVKDCMRFLCNMCLKEKITDLETKKTELEKNITLFKKVLNELLKE